MLPQARRWYVILPSPLEVLSNIAPEKFPKSKGVKAQGFHNFSFQDGKFGCLLWGMYIGGGVIDAFLRNC